MSTKSNFERLHDAGVLNAAHYSDHDKLALEGITHEETEALISLKKKMGDVPADKEHMRPNFPV